MATTGYSDTFGRTVSNSFGTATSGQVYTVIGTAADYSVAPNIGSIAPSTSASNRAAIVDLLTSDVDLSGQIAFSALPGTNTLHGGFIYKRVDSNNFYTARIVVSTAGAVSLRFDKLVAGVATTIATVSIASITVVAGTFYNFRTAATWSQTLQTNVLQAKMWALGATEPGGWMATTTDNALTGGGTLSGPYARNEATVTGAIVRFQAVSSRSNNLPYPATTDPMCYDPAITYPRQTAIKSLADATDTVVAGFDPDVVTAGLYPRVRVSNSAFTIDSSLTFIIMPFTTTEFNFGTLTDLTLDSQQLYLPLGIWMVSAELRIVAAASDSIDLGIHGTDSIAVSTDIYFRSNPTQANNEGVGGTGHISKLVVSADPVTPARCFMAITPTSSTALYTVVYAALTAIKISDYFV